MVYSLVGANSVRPRLPFLCTTCEEIVLRANTVRPYSSDFKAEKNLFNSEYNV